MPGPDDNNTGDLLAGVPVEECLVNIVDGGSGVEQPCARVHDRGEHVEMGGDLELGSTVRKCRHGYEAAVRYELLDLGKVCAQGHMVCG